MKASLFYILLSLGLSCFSQEEGMKAMLGDSVGSYGSKEAAIIEYANDGSIKVSRTYYGGETLLEIRVSLPPESARAEIKTQIGKLMNLFAEMNADGRMQAETMNSSAAYGVLTFSEGIGGAIVLINNKYLLEVQLTGVTSIEISKEVFLALDFSLLQ